MDGNIELQLLCVVMGDSCVVKVERGEFSLEPFILAGCEIRSLSSANSPLVIKNSFARVRAAIDAFEEKPPVPRIERTHKGYRLITKESHCRLDQMSLFTSAYNALSQLAGKPLPIWRPTKGEWKQVVRQQLSDGNPTGAGCDVWRYTRRNDETA